MDKRKQSIVTPVMDWQVKARLVGTEDHEYIKQSTNLMNSIVDVTKQAGLYHIDGEEGVEEYLHMQYVMIDPTVFYAMAEALNLNDSSGQSFKHLNDIINNVHNKDEGEE